jgi:DNA gyrase subunit A
MHLARLTGLEAGGLRAELEELEEAIAGYRELVDRESARRARLGRELEELGAEYGDPRRTEILDDADDFPLPSGAGGEANLVLLTRRGYIKSQPVRGGGMAGAEAVASRERDFVRQAFICRGSDEILWVTRQGNVHSLDVSELPRGTRSSRGRPLSEFLELEEGDEVAAALPVRSDDAGGYLLTASRGGQVKRTELSEYENVRSGGIIGAGVAEDDEILSALVTDGTDQVVLATRHGQAIRFEESEIRAMGRSARGVKGIDLVEGDEAVALLAPHRDAELLAATARGFAKRVPFTELRLQGRAGKGMSLLPERDEAGDLVNLLEIRPGDRIMWEQDDGAITATDADYAVARARNEASLRVLDLTRQDPPVAALHPLRTSAREEEIGSSEGEVDDAGEPAGAAEGEGEAMAEEPTGEDADEAADGSEEEEQPELDLSG